MLKALWSARPQKKNKAAGSAVLISISGFDILWRKSPRRRCSLALKLDKSGQLVVMTPVNTDEREIRRFINARQSWIHRQLSSHAVLMERKQQAIGVSLQFLGDTLEIKALKGPRNLSEQHDRVLHVTSRQTEPAKDYLEQRASAWLRAQAEEMLPQRLQSQSIQTGLRGNDLQIKSYRARWGSCRHDGAIQLNWKLIMAPPEVIDYVIVHELSHLQHFNHSAAFWALVNTHCAEYQRQRQWLKQHGKLLITR